MLAAQDNLTLITVSSHLPSLSESVTFEPKHVRHTALLPAWSRKKGKIFLEVVFFLIKRTHLMIFGSIRFIFSFFIFF